MGHRYLQLGVVLVIIFSIILFQIKRPTDLNLRIKLLNLYQEGERYEEAYSAAISTDLTIAFVGNGQWYEVLASVFQVMF